MKTNLLDQRSALLRNELQASPDGQQTLMHLSASARTQTDGEISPVWDQSWEQSWPQTWEQTWVAQSYMQEREEEDLADSV